MQANEKYTIYSTTSAGINCTNNIVDAASGSCNDVKYMIPANSELNYQKEASGTAYPVSNNSTKLNESTVSNSNNDRKIFNENSVFNWHNNEGFELQAIQQEENSI